MNNRNAPEQLPVDVREALEAICTYGKGRCWYCDLKLPKAKKAIRDRWDVQRIEQQPIASIILVCPACLERQGQLRERQSQLSPAALTPNSGVRPPRGMGRLTLQPRANRA